MTRSARRLQAAAARCPRRSLLQRVRSRRRGVRLERFEELVLTYLVDAELVSPSSSSLDRESLFSVRVSNA